MRSVPKSKIMQDLECQQDILEFLQKGGTIVTVRPRKAKKVARRELVLSPAKIVSL